MMKEILFAIWFFLPAGLGNAAPVFAAKAQALDRYKRTIDGGMRFRGKLLFGEHKTWLGIVAATIVGGTVGLLQWIFANVFNLNDFPISTYQSPSAIKLGLLLGFGAIIGDLIKSFFKRQFGVKSGGTWFPFDQIDYIIGGLVFSRVMIHLELSQLIVIVTVWFLLHPISTVAGYFLGIRENPI
jgi:CDP-2,3-bis-(O-geranylgeranyl)-sn-glycerol synthase